MYQRTVIKTAFSRTDSGVSAFHSTMHVDLSHKRGEAYKTQIITLVLNKYFSKGNIPIRILKTYRVPNIFNCKKAASRTYLYRLAIKNANNLHEAHFMHHIPIEEHDRCLFMWYVYKGSTRDQSIRFCLYVAQIHLMLEKCETQQSCSLESTTSVPSLAQVKTQRQELQENASCD